MENCDCAKCREHRVYRYRCKFSQPLDDNLCDHPSNKCSPCEAHGCPVLRLGGSLKGHPVADAIWPGFPHTARKKVWNVHYSLYLTDDSEETAGGFTMYSEELPLEHVIDNFIEKYGSDGEESITKATFKKEE